MSDDLVKQARYAALSDMEHWRSVSLIEKLADRIEELEAKLAKLARAAKPFAAIKIKDGRSQPGEIGRTDVTNLRAALVELKGEGQ